MSKIFLIEDEVSLAEMYQRVFEQKGHEVDIATNGQEALDKLQNIDKNYDIILLDIMMPKLNGIEVLKKLKNENSKWKDTPVYLLTNLGQDSVIQESKDLGADGYFIKANYIPIKFVEEVEKIL